jgi:hypothetical protein
VQPIAIRRARARARAEMPSRKAAMDACVTMIGHPSPWNSKLQTGRFGRL